MSDLFNLGFDACEHIIDKHVDKALDFLINPITKLVMGRPQQLASQQPQQQSDRSRRRPSSLNPDRARGGGEDDARGNSRSRRRSASSPPPETGEAAFIAPREPPLYIRETAYIGPLTRAVDSTTLPRSRAAATTLIRGERSRSPRPLETDSKAAGHRQPRQYDYIYYDYYQRSWPVPRAGAEGGGGGRATRYREDRGVRERERHRVRRAGRQNSDCAKEPARKRRTRYVVVEDDRDQLLTGSTAGVVGGAVGAVVGGVVAQMARVAVGKELEKMDEEDGKDGKDGKMGIIGDKSMTTVLGAAVGALAANAVVEKWEEGKREAALEQARWEGKFGRVGKESERDCSRRDRRHREEREDRGYRSH